MDTMLSSDELFEPDYSEDTADHNAMDIDHLETSEFNCEHNANTSNSGINLGTNITGLVDPKTTGRKSVCFLPDQVIKNESANDDILECEGVYCDDDFVEKNDVKLEPEVKVDENAIRMMCEKTLKTAISGKQWNIVGEVFKKVFSSHNLSEQLSFFCADQLTCPTEFFGLIKQLKVSNYDIVSLIGSKLLVNADLCMNHQAGTLILKMMMDEDVLFHHLTIKMFAAEDVLKSAVNACIHEKDYSLLAHLCDKSRIFELKSNGSNKSPKIYRLCDFNNILKNAMDHLIQHGNKSASSQASACLSLLKVSLEEANLVETTIDKIITPDMAWFLCKIFIDESMLDELTSMLNLCQKFPDLIVWNHSNCNAIIHSFIVKDVNQISNIAKIFLDIVYKNNILPVYKDFSSVCTTLTLFSAMTENAMKLFVLLFVDSAKKHNRNNVGKIEWNLHLMNTNLTSMGYNQAIKVVNAILFCFSNLKYDRNGNVYSVKQYFVVKAKPRPKINGKFKASNIQTLKKLDVKHNVDKKLNFRERKSSLTASSVQQNGGLKSDTDYPDVPRSIKNHPRFSKYFHKNNPDSNISSRPPPLAPNISIPRQEPRVENPTRFPKMDNRRSNEGPPRNIIRAPFLQSVPKSSDFKTFKRLKSDVSLRLTFYVNSDQLSQEDATASLDKLTYKCFHQLARMESGDVIYDDEAFEKMQLLLDADIKNMIRSL